MAELSDGRVRINSRSYNGNRHRKTAVSEDGGETWAPLVDIEEQTEPQCNGGFIRFSDAKDGEKSRLVYTGPVAQRSRTQGTVFVSYDEGETWATSKELVTGKFAYSALTRVANGQVGCLFETGDKDAYDIIRFASFNMEWASGGKDALKNTGN